MIEPSVLDAGVKRRKKSKFKEKLLAAVENYLLYCDRDYGSFELHFLAEERRVANSVVFEDIG